MRNFIFMQRDETASVITGSASAPIAPVFYTDLNNSNNTSNFQGLFDQWRLIAWSLRLKPRCTAVNLAATNTYAPPLACIVDYDDGTALASYAAATARSSCIELSATESCERTIKPHAAVAAYSGSFTSYINVEAPWCDTQSPSVQHYGFKFYMNQCNSGEIPVWDIQSRYYFEFRNVI
jgi:hypothetical protein